MSWEVINFSLFSLCPCLPPSLSPSLSSGSLPHSFHYFQLVIFSHSATSLAQRPFLHFNSELITALIETVIALIALINHLSCGKAFVGICNSCWHWLFVECCRRARINIFTFAREGKNGRMGLRTQSWVWLGTSMRMDLFDLQIPEPQLWLWAENSVHTFLCTHKSLCL